MRLICIWQMAARATYHIISWTWLTSVNYCKYLFDSLGAELFYMKHNPVYIIHLLFNYPQNLNMQPQARLTMPILDEQIQNQLVTFRCMNPIHQQVWNLFVPKYPMYSMKMLKGQEGCIEMCFAISFLFCEVQVGCRSFNGLVMG